MPHRAHLFSLRIAHAFRESCLTGAYRRRHFAKDVLAGLTVGIIAIPLAMALAIASGVPPQYGLYTAIVAGFLIPLLGGSRFSISGPTAAFVVILHPIAARYGLGGLLVATVMAGFILVALSLLRLGRLIEYIPESVTLGFTAGIAVVIAVLQIDDFFGMGIGELPESFVSKLWLMASSLSSIELASFALASLTLAIMIIWPRFKIPLSAHLIAVSVGSVIGALLVNAGFEIDTIGSRFSYEMADGSQGMGIPAVLPSFVWPWQQVGADGLRIEWNWQILRELLPAAFAIAMLGAIESLLCAVVLDNATGTRHSANSELLGQGIGNIVAPFFGGITATAALARSSANLRAGAQSPVAGMVHGAVVLLSLLLLADLLAYLPMPVMAAMLVMVAWNMSEAPKGVHLLRTAPPGDILVFTTCFLLTVFFDMVIAVSAGIVMAALLFMKEVAAMTKVSDISENSRIVSQKIPTGWRVFKISGPLFFAAADRVFADLAQRSKGQIGVVLCMDAVPILDAGGLSALEKFLSACRRDNIKVFIADLQFQPLKSLAKAGIKASDSSLTFFPSLAEALVNLPSDHLASDSVPSENVPSDSVPQDKEDAAKPI